jgi:hypothetical protein
MTTRPAKRSAPHRSGADPVDASSGSFCRQEGEYWTIVYDGTLFRLRDAKGLRYLAHLLRHPGERVQCDALVSVAGGGTSAAVTSRERTRVAVTKRLKATLAKIATLHPALAQHLTTRIRTGYVCLYVGDADRLVAWRS